MTAPDKAGKSFSLASLSLTSTVGSCTGKDGDAFLGGIGVLNNEAGSESRRCGCGTRAPGMDEEGRRWRSVEEIPEGTLS